MSVAVFKQRRQRYEPCEQRYLQRKKLVTCCNTLAAANEENSQTLKFHLEKT